PNTSQTTVFTSKFDRSTMPMMPSPSTRHADYEHVQNGRSLVTSTTVRIEVPGQTRTQLPIGVHTSNDQNTEATDANHRDRYCSDQCNWMHTYPGHKLRR